MNHPVRVFLFKHYWWITALVVIAAVSVIVSVGQPDTVTGSIVTLGVGALGVVYFVQKQKIEELQLFERLFTQFNVRYAAMNADLQRVATGQEADAARIRHVLDDYFNLCAEEYLFYEQGRILPSAWRAWCRGICTYLECEQIRMYWDREVSRDSHYGLTSDIIRQGAVLPTNRSAAAPNQKAYYGNM
jgi:hypothetical protein